MRRYYLAALIVSLLVLAILAIASLLEPKVTAVPAPTHPPTTLPFP